MVMCVLNWNQGELVGLTLGCSILPILQYFKIIQTIPSTIKIKTNLGKLIITEIDFGYNNENLYRFNLKNKISTPVKYKYVYILKGIQVSRL